MPKKKKKGKKGGKKGAPVAEPPPPPPPRVPVWPHGAVPDWQRSPGDTGAAVPEWQRLPAVAGPPPADAKLCYDRFRTGPVSQGPNIEDNIFATASELSGRKELRIEVDRAYKSTESLSGNSMRERLGRYGLPTHGAVSELRARLGAFAAASSLIAIAHAEGVSEDKIRGAHVGDIDGDSVDTETQEALTTLIITERIARKEAAAQAAQAAVEGALCLPLFLPRVRAPRFSTRLATQTEWTCVRVCTQRRSLPPAVPLSSSARSSAAHQRPVLPIDPALREN
eukprot:COSAG06_NODE_151_length_21964_cov_95.963961_4_plen_282_part_00